ncbi:MAG: hypothetical protein V4596_02530 [Bdellovibrionota bacterium]
MLRLLGIILCGSLYLITMLGCTSLDRSTVADNNYYSLVKDYSDRAEFYSGFMNVFQIHATILNQKVLEAQVEKKASSFNWSDTQKSEDMAKITNSLRGETTVFVSFYTPENKLNNLDSPSSIWRVFLDVNNKRYVGSVSTYVGFANEAQLFYPYHTIFGKGYLVRFPVPMMNIQDYPMSLTVTGTIGSDTIKFPAMKN